MSRSASVELGRYASCVLGDSPWILNLLSLTVVFICAISNHFQSTTLARLLSNISAEKFWDEINAREGYDADEVKIANITIGHTVNSTTVVPRVYGIGSLFVCDMPGFAETDPQKKISIEILQKIFLTRIPNSTLLIVADIALIQDTKIERLLQHYHRALQRLLGAQYESAVDHFYFVLTKNHIDNLDSRYVRMMVDSKALEISDSDMSAMRFLKRLARCNVLVDLKTDNNVVLLEKIQKMIDVDQVKKKGREKETTFKIQKLQASENLLNRMTIRNLGMIRKLQFQFVDSINALSVRLANLQEDIKAETDAVRVDWDRVLQEHKDVKHKQNEVQKQLDLYPPTRVRICEEIEDKEAVLSVRTKHEELVEEHFTIAEFITYRCDVAKEQPGIGRSKKYSIHLNADTTGDGSVEHFVLVMDYETADSTLRKFINRGESMLPKSLHDLKDIDLASVLYNSHKHINICKAEIIGNAVSGGVITLKISHTKRFKVYVYSSTPFKSIAYYDDLKESFENAKVQNIEEIDQLQQSVKDLDDSKGPNEERLRDLKEEVAKAKEAIGRLMDEASNKRQVHEKRCSDFITAVNQLEKDVKTSKADERLLLISKIDEIFHRNKLEANISEILAETKMAFVPIERDLQFLIDGAKRFEETNADMLERIKIASFSGEGDASSTF